ncbi:mannose-1-phosphate guanylyltransferase/mannose-6-phosphate isomerase [Nevskia sp.]|uniref:mannose-1-phosphate guanylyltransferase/mannose-6-phosphate isomerase n=1 Tax=Nevskia sp. TaxID=1929292 RepID=UPI0025DF20B1|nr:mannose-1-phosphate guanylyltransferase/mannose-6-phosphate isomerase [Nevskia sp.]
MTLLPVLLAGGTGSRLWPLSREHYPKQFLALTDSNSLLQNTALRTQALPGVVAPLAICAEQHRFVVAEQLRAVDMTGARVLLEPEGRNTGPAATCAALLATELHGHDTVLFVMAADHVIPDAEAFAKASAIAIEAAKAGHIVSFGIQPTHPETGFGYIRAGAAVSVDGACQIAEFVEKPPLAKAEAFLAAGDYYWNGGMFLFRADVFLDEVRRLEPDMLAACQKALAEGSREMDFVRLHGPSFREARNESIDYAVMEKTDKAALVTLDAGWDDIGSWNYLAKLPDVDARGNVARGDVMFEDCDGTLVHGSHRLVTALGLTDTVIVETIDAVLVASRDRLQDVKKIVTRLKAAQRSEAVARPRVYRPWGWYETISLADRFQVKRIMVKPGEKLSLQMHHHRAEHWVVVSGTARVTNGDKVFLLGEDQSTYIPLGHTHRLENPGKLPLELIEVQSGSYLGEDDIVRFEDVYGRTPVPAGMP